MGGQLLQRNISQPKRVARRQIVLPSCRVVSQRSRSRPLASELNLPIAHASELDISGLAVLCLDILHPLLGNFFGGLEVLVLPRNKIEVRIVQRRRRMLSNTILDDTGQINVCVRT